LQSKEAKLVKEEITHTILDAGLQSFSPCWPLASQFGCRRAETPERIVDALHAALKMVQRSQVCHLLILGRSLVLILFA
jgi:hypothetical protein